MSTSPNQGDWRHGTEEETHTVRTVKLGTFILHKIKWDQYTRLNGHNNDRENNITARLLHNIYVVNETPYTRDFVGFERHSLAITLHETNRVEPMKTPGATHRTLVMTDLLSRTSSPRPHRHYGLLVITIMTWTTLLLFVLYTVLYIEKKENL